MGNRPTNENADQKPLSGVTMEELREHGIHLKNLSLGNHRTTCPNCSQTRRKKTDPCLSVTLDDEGGAVWLCHHCDWSGNITGRRDYFPTPKQKPTFRVVKEPEDKSVSEQVIDWFAGRGISQDTLEAFGIYRAEQSFGAAPEGCVAFPYYDDGQCVNVKYRTKDKKFRQEANAKRSLFNKDNVNPREGVIFVEGEMDVLACYESGLTNAVSLPDGAPKEAKFNPHDKRFEALQNCEWIGDVDNVYIGVDRDEAGQALEAELVHRFGKDRCWIIRWPEDCKDANETLQRFGKDAVLDAYNQAEPFPVDGVFTIRDYRDEVFSIYEGKYAKPLDTGFPNLDEIYQVMPSTFQLVTGIPNHGKSNFMDQLAVNMCRRHDWKFAVYSPEHSTAQHIRRLVEKVAKKPFDVGPNVRMTKDQLGSALDFLDDRFHFIEVDDEIPTIDWLLNKCRLAVLRYGVRGVIIDPYNEIDATRDGGKREDEHIRDLISKCKSFARKHNITMWMVAHPAKMQRGHDGAYPPPSLYDVSGAAHWNNMCDVGLVVHRDFEEGTTQVITRKIREQGVYGAIGDAWFRYNLTTQCYEPHYQDDDPRNNSWTIDD